MVKILCTTSDNYQSIFARFESSIAPCLNNGFELVLNKIDLDNYGKYGFGEDSWYMAIFKKLMFVKDFLHSEKVSENDYIIVSDADIQFIRPDGLRELVDIASRNDLDYYGMREGGTDGYNGGFYIIKCCQKVRAFYDELVEKAQATRNTYADQEILNDLLKENPHGLKHDKIDKCYCVWGNNNPGEKSVFHHATCAKNNDEKLKQMDRVKWRYDLMLKRKPIMQRTRPTRTVHIVVAKYNEDMRWLQNVMKSPRLQNDNIKLFVYDKGPKPVIENEVRELMNCDVEVCQLPNVGRESDTYLRHILCHYTEYKENPDIFVVFLQGHIDEHIDTYLPPRERRRKRSEATFVADLIDDAMKHEGVSTTSAIDHPLCAEHLARPVFTLGEWAGKKLQCVSGELTLGPWFEKITSGHVWPSSKPLWWKAALFCASSKRLVTALTPKMIYMILEDLAYPDPVAGHYMERSWYALLTLEAS